MSFRAIFVAIVIATGMIVAALLVNQRRPVVEVAQPTAELVRATGKCASCHAEETSAVVHEFEASIHAARGVTCLDCHRPVEGQEPLEHRGFTIGTITTAANCSQCHPTQYRQYLRSRHAAPAWAAVTGRDDFTQAQIDFAEQFHPGAVDREANVLARLEGGAATNRGCMQCHSIGRPNADSSIGQCTACHARHLASVELARTPETCGQCHMGPDHAQIEIYHESKHGVLFNSQKHRMNLAADPKRLTTRDMPVPTCATCHMSGLGGLEVTHDTTERLSYWLFADITERRPSYLQGQAEMKELCLECHTSPRIDRFYEEAEEVVESTNRFVRRSREIVDELRRQGQLTPEPFDEPIEFLAFDIWHYFGRTAKHGAFMGGADFVQWHGFYELLAKTTELERMAREHTGPDADSSH